MSPLRATDNGGLQNSGTLSSLYGVWTDGLTRTFVVGDGGLILSLQ